MAELKPLNESQNVPLTFAMDSWDVPKALLNNFGRVPQTEMSINTVEAVRQMRLQAQIQAMMAIPQRG